MLTNILFQLHGQSNSNGEKDNINTGGKQIGDTQMGAGKLNSIENVTPSLFTLVSWVRKRPKF